LFFNMGRYADCSLDYLVLTKAVLVIRSYVAEYCRRRVYEATL